MAMTHPVAPSGRTCRRHETDSHASSSGRSTNLLIRQSTVNSSGRGEIALAGRSMICHRHLIRLTFPSFHHFSLQHHSCALRMHLDGDECPTVILTKIVSCREFTLALFACSRDTKGWCRPAELSVSRLGGWELRNDSIHIHLCHSN